MENKNKEYLDSLKNMHPHESGEILEQIIEYNKGFFSAVSNIQGTRNRIFFIYKQIERSLWDRTFPNFFNLITFLARNYSVKHRIKPSMRKKIKSIYVYRSNRGIGDLIMITPAIIELLEKFPNSEIDLYTKEKYFQIFSGIKRLNLIDYKKFNKRKKYDLGYTLSNPCPALMHENIKKRNTKLSRIELFAKAMNIKLKNYKPVIKLTEQEIKKAKQILKQNEINSKQKLIGIQLHSAKTHRDYPYMNQLIKKIIKQFPNTQIITFGLDKDKIYKHKKVKHLKNLKLRELFALVNLCDLIICPDSSSVHIAAAFDKPTIALFGPIGVYERLKHYPFATAITSKRDCVPCWKPWGAKCKLTKSNKSLCMYDIKTDDIIKKIKDKLK